VGYFVIVCALVAIIGASVGYRLASSKWAERYNTNQKADFLVSLLEMQTLRGGDSASVLPMLETECYAKALQVLDMPHNESTNVVISSALNKLVRYRSKYARPEPEWSRTEKRLAVELLEWNRSTSTNNQVAK
jgi:hypothetical protein